MKNSKSSLLGIATQGLSKHYMQAGRDLSVLTGISVKFQTEKSYAVVGVSGSGKSTLLHLLGGLDEPSQGSVWYDENNIANLSKIKRLQLLQEQIGFVFQFHYLIKELTVIENCMLPAAIAGLSKEAALCRACELLEHVGLKTKMNALVSTLSGGEQQRVSLARALCNKPSFLLADEPTGSLDAANATLVIDLMLACQKEWGMGIIICTHDKSVYERMDTIYHIEQGKLL